MRLFLIFLLFLFTLFSLFSYKFLKDKNFYLDVNLDLERKSLKNLVLNLERIFNTNVYVNFKGIKFGKVIEVKRGKIVIVRLKKKRKKAFILKRIHILQIPLNLKVDYLDVWVGSKERINRVTVKNASLINNELSGNFIYTNLNNFTLNGNVKVKIEKRSFKILNLFLDSKYFSAKAEGVIGEKKGEIFTRVKIKEIRKPNFFLSGAVINAKGNLNLPVLKITGKGYIENLLVSEKDYGSIEGNFKGEYKLFERLFLKGNATNPEGTEINFTYKVIPEGKLNFSFENLKVDKKTLGVKGEVEGFFSGNGRINFRKRILNLKAHTKNLTILDKNFKGDLEFLYTFSGKGSLKFEFKNVGFARGEFKIVKKKLDGKFSFYNFPVVFKDFSAYLSGEGELKKEKSLELKAKIFADKGKYRDFSLERVISDVVIRDKNVNAKVYYGKSYGVINGSFKSLKGIFYLKDLTLRGKGKSINISGGNIEFSTKGQNIKAEGELKNLFVSVGNVHSNAGVKFSLEKKEKELSFEAKGILNAKMGERKILENFMFSTLFINKNLKVLGSSKDTFLKIVYDISDKRGNFYGKILKKDFGVAVKGRINDKKIFSKFQAFYKVLKEKLKLKGEFSLKEGELKLSLLPTKYKGKKFSYYFGGLDVVLKDETLISKFKGIKVTLLDREFLSISPAIGKGTLKNFSFTPAQIGGVLRGNLRVSYKGSLFIDSSGKLNLTLLSKHVGSVIKSRLEGELVYEFSLKGNKFKFLAKNEYPVNIKSLYFYEPFGAAINVEAQKDKLAFALTGWFKEGYLNAYALSQNFKDFEIELLYKNVPLKLKDGVRARIKADGKGKVVVKNFKKILISLNTFFDGYVKVKKFQKKKKEKGKLPVDVSLNVDFKTKNGLVIRLPEGRVYTAIEGKVFGKLPEPYYRVNVVLKSGRLNYFGREFFVKRSTINLIREKDKELMEFNFYMNTVSDGYKIFLFVYGTPDNPKIYYFSEPPLSREQILFRLISGGVSKGLLPVGTILASELNALGYVKGTLERMLDVNVELGIKTSSTGEVGALVRLKKKLGSYLSVYYQTASTKDKKDTFWGAEIKAPGSLELGFSFNVYSDNTREYKLRYVKEFDF